jgi:gamma-glutamyl:cysteine ligase YbdK (ATP-grasp superfamily)
MADTRQKNALWKCATVAPDGSVTCSEMDAQRALLMDIRDELQQLNGIFGCANFLEMPHNLLHVRRAAEGLRRDLAKKNLRKSAKFAVKKKASSC